MEFKKLKTDELALLADLISREANDRNPALAAALRRIAIIEEGIYGKYHPDIRLTISLASGLEAAVEASWWTCKASFAELTASVEEIVGAAERTFNDRDEALKMLREVRSTLSREISKGRRRKLPYRLLDVTLMPSRAGLQEKPAATIGIEVIGSLLLPQRLSFDAECAEHVIEVFQSIKEKQVTRLAMRGSLLEMGADVMIDPVTLAALEDAGIAPATAVAVLQAEECAIVDVDVKHGSMVLYVRDGVVTGNVPLGEDMRWRDGRICMPQSLGISPASVRGEPLSSFLTHSYFDRDAQIAYGTNVADRVWLHVRTKPVAISLTSRRLAA